VGLAISGERGYSIRNKKVVRAGLKKELVRGRERYFALLCIEGKSYRNKDYLAQVTSELQALDLGPGVFGQCSSEEGSVLPLLTPEAHQERKDTQKQKRRLQRKQQRSRRANNPQAFRKDGTSIKGERQHKKSKHGQKITQSLQKLSRNESIHRQQEQQDLIRYIITTGGNKIAIEDLDYRSWQRCFGNTTGFTAPGEFIDRLEAECEITGGELLKLNHWVLALSQYCLCGHRVKKPRNCKVHVCEHCGLGQNTPLDREIFSAFLARLRAELGSDEKFFKFLESQKGAKQYKTSSGNLSGTFRKSSIKNREGVRAQAVALCTQQSPRVLPLSKQGLQQRISVTVVNPLQDSGDSNSCLKASSGSLSEVSTQEPACSRDNALRLDQVPDITYPEVGLTATGKKKRTAKASEDDNDQDKDSKTVSLKPVSAGHF